MDFGYGLVQAEDAIIMLNSNGFDAGSANLLNFVGHFEGCSRHSDVGDR